MIIVGQNGDKSTESLEFDIKEKKTCKNIVIDEKLWQKFKKITGKKANMINLKELTGLGEFLNQDLTKSDYVIKEVKSNRLFGIYLTKEKAKKELQEILKRCGEQKIYQMKKEELEITIL